MTAKFVGRFLVRAYPELLLVKAGKLLSRGITKGSILKKELDFLEHERAGD